MRATSFSRSGFPVFAVAGLMVVALWVTIASALHTAEREDLEKAAAASRNIARSLAEHVASSVRTIDVVLMHLQTLWIESSTRFPDQVGRQQEILRRENVSQVMVAAADGRIVYSSLPGFIGVDVSDQPYFRGHEVRSRNELQISAPALDPALKQWTIKFTRPVYAAQNRFAGVVAMFVPPPGLEQIYKDIELGAKSTISLVRADGQILARSPELSEASAISLADVPGLEADAAPNGAYRRIAKTDGIERQYSYQKVPGYPLTVYVGQSTEALLAPHREQRASYLALGALATFLLLVSSTLLVSRRHNKEAAEHALQAQINHLQLVYDTSSAAIFDVDAGGVITHANRRMAEMFARPITQLIGSEYLSHIDPDERDSGNYSMSSLMKGEVPVLDRERHYRRGDGSDFWGRITGRRILDAAGGVIGLVGVIVDISQAKRAEAALRRNEAHLRELFDAFPIEIAHVDRAQRMSFANRAYRNTYRGDPTGRLVREFIGEQAYAVVQPSIERALAGESVHLEHSFADSDGRIATRSLRYVPERDATGEVIGFFALREDVSERRRAEDRIRKINEELERRVRERTTELRAANEALQGEVRERRLAETAALNLANRLRSMTRRLGEAQEVERRRLSAELHDGVCSNLAAIGLNLALLQRQLPNSDAASLQRRLSELIALIDEAKANAKDISVDLRPLLLEDRDLFSALEEYARKFEGSTGIAVRVKGANSGVRLPAEKKIALFRIAQEALTNCAKHAQASEIAIEFNLETDFQLLSVADDGIGIDLAGVNGKKHGLGMLSMQERAETIGGEWQIESAPGKGTRISVTVGAAPAS